MLALESFRLGLSCETLKPIADEMRRNGLYAPDQFEAFMIGQAIDGRDSLARPPRGMAEQSTG